ncbi:hypothetical protein [Natrinema limicola]|uniref:Uncharacterized protein n=1 Tax=Natrinema limicola JCM 13563 TaxID=1230457 RepID=M0C2K9_9EURY|nr:hypothetical protein [Natrinema limicola]ELZ17445.1 hypothetical protein C476_15885 [Natrinema limicola JCM 13563]
MNVSTSSEAKHRDDTDTAGQNDVTIGRAAAAVAGGDGRESATDFVLTAVRQYEFWIQSDEQE